MLKRALTAACLALCLTAQAPAETADYHLKRLEIQARAVLAILGEPAVTAPQNQEASEEFSPEGLEGETAVSSEQDPELQQRLDRAVEAPTWAENMAREDLHSVLATAQTLQDELRNGGTDEYLKARVELESLARRLRVSTAPLELAPQDRASLELMMLELDETANVLSQEREQELSRKESRRRGNRINLGIGVGYGGWGPWGVNNAWGPWGYNRYGWNTWYRPYPRFYRRSRRCR